MASKTFEDCYTIGEQLGAGAYATVYRCTHRARGDEWAVKVIDKTKAGPKDISDTLHEINMMKIVGYHPNVVRLLEFFDTPNRMFLVLEVLEGGMLFDRIVQMKHYSEASASRLIKNFLLAMEHIHSKGIIHRDLKPENLLLKRKTSATETDVSHLTDFCVADFGLSGKSPGQTCCGSPSYIAPEVINVGYLRTQKEPYDTKADVWSVGVVTYILLSGKMPFHGRNFKETFAKIVKGQWAFVGDIFENVSDNAKTFIKLLLTMDPKQRPSASQALQHPWVATVQSDLHLAGSIEGIKQFNAERKLRGAMLAFRATTSFLGSLDQTPPFLKFLTHANKLSTVIQAQSQTDPGKSHHVDFSRALLKAINPQWDMRDCCTCGSAKVCRHIQNAHQYLFVGAAEHDIQPFVYELQSMRQDTAIDLEEKPGDATLRHRLEEIDECIAAANAFHAEYMRVPQDSKKPNFLVVDRPVTEERKDAAVSKALNMFKK